MKYGIDRGSGDFVGAAVNLVVVMEVELRAKVNERGYQGVVCDPLNIFSQKGGNYA
jgi:hypothetical protein